MQQYHPVNKAGCSTIDRDGILVLQRKGQSISDME